MSFDFDEDDEPKTQPKPQEKEDKGFLNDKGVKDLMPILLLVGVAFLFKDQIMEMFKGGPTGAPSTESKSEKGGDRKRGGKRRRRRAGGDGRRRRRREGMGTGDKTATETAESAFGQTIANV